MFKIPRANLIESDEGFTVEVLGRTGVLYTEGERSLRVDSEILGGPSGLAIYGDSIAHWDPPEDHEPISEEKRAEIVDNIKRAFEFRGIRIQIL
jgi:hypothetical protein